VDSLDIGTPQAEAKWSALQGILTGMVLLCGKTSLTCGVIYAPAPFQYDPSAGRALKAVGIHLRSEWLNERSELEARLEQWATEKTVPYLSLTDEFRREAATHPPGFYNFEFDGHWNANGHRLAADTIKRWLEERGLVSRLSSG
jgi:hypothetical protein